jgi:glutamate dehydrogenase (NAD(P)+)
LNTTASFIAACAKLEQAFAVLSPEMELSVFDRSTNTHGFVVVFNAVGDPAHEIPPMGKGGTRIAPLVTLDEIRMLARTMALKNAAAGLPLGGAKSGLAADPDAAGFERIYRHFVRSIKPVLVENGGIFGGFGFDIGARPDHPTWACDELQSYRCFTGKPIALGGTDYDVEGIAGLGVATAAKTLISLKGEDLRLLSYAVQGLGAMGAGVIRYFHDSGARLGVISDPRIGGTHYLDPSRFTDPSYVSRSGSIESDLVAAIASQQFEQTNRILQTIGSEPHPLDNIITCQTDILFPCAVHGVINEMNAAQIRARYIVEGANNPSTDIARSLVHDRGITVIPDFIANAGGIIAAYVELTMHISPEENLRTRAKVIRAKELTTQKISTNVHRLIELCDRYGVEPVIAGRYMALNRLVEGIQF